MKKLTLTLLAGAALAIPAMAPATAQNPPQNQQPQTQQNGQPQAKQNNTQQPNQQASEPNQNGQQASNEAISPNQLGHNGVRKVQQALAKHGFHAGRADGIWGPGTRTALKDFQKSKGLPSKGRLNQQTLADLGVNIAMNDTGNQNNDQNGSANPQLDQNQPNQNQPSQNQPNQKQ